ncbi:MAG: protein-L-isoaspartate(D-aspartate) O-methyltransferase [Candidatus Omnitrophica bacterium]|nr:protein-L-isoaspartate(D-aspartate) O-methyltransferase [Candidatus Omnitrophota bacterium]
MIFLLSCALVTSPVFAFVSTAELKRQREEMVKTQIEARGVKDPRVLAAMRSVPRDLFVPERFRSVAYMDQPLPIGEGQTISQPYIVALMTELAEVEPDEKVLEVGTGSGYQAAVLFQITKKVYSIEISPTLSEFARKNLRRAGCSGVKLAVGDGYEGWAAQGPFDAILVTAAPDHIPQPLLDQLAEGGVLVIPVGQQRGIQRLTKVRRKEGRLITEESTLVSFVPLVRKKIGVQ